MTDCGQGKYSSEVDFLRSKLSGYEAALLVCDGGEENIRILFREFMAAVFVRRALEKALADIRQQSKTKAAAKAKPAKKKVAKKGKRR